MAQGNKVAVGPLEETARAILGVEGVCLFNGVDAAGRDEVVVAIEADQAPSPERLEAIANALPAFESVRVAAFTAFPRTMVGGLAKVDRLALRRLACPEGPGR